MPTTIVYSYKLRIETNGKTKDITLDLAEDDITALFDVLYRAYPDAIITDYLNKEVKYIST